MIRFACPSCGAVFTAADEKGGKTGSCAKCSTQFIIPAAASTPTPKPVAPPPPPPKPSPPKPSSGAAPMAKVIKTDSTTSTRVKESKVDDDQPRERRRSAFDDDDDERDDRPRSRRRNDNDDYDDDDRDRRSRRKPKKLKSKGMTNAILTAGILFIVFGLLVLVLAIVDVTELKPSSGIGSSRSGAPKELQSALSQLETAFLFFQIAIYSSLAVGAAFIVAGIGLLIQMMFGRIVGFVGSGLAALAVLCWIVGVILLLTISGPKGETMGGSIPTNVVLKWLLRIIALVGPAVTALVTLFRGDVTTRLK
jgi:hypothetical protein